MRKLETISALASAVINNIVAGMDITSNEMSLYELYNDDGEVIGWYQSMTNNSVEDFNIFIRVYVEVPSQGKEFWGELEILTPNKKRSHFDSLKIKLDGELYSESRCHTDTDTHCAGMEILDDIEERYEIYKKLLVSML